MWHTTYVINITTAPSEKKTHGQRFLLAFTKLAANYLEMDFTSVSTKTQNPIDVIPIRSDKICGFVFEPVPKYNSLFNDIN
jgi:hypothetical protein